MTTQRRSRGILGGPVDGPARVAHVYPSIVGEVGMLVEHRGNGFRGRITKITAREVTITGESGLARIFPLEPGRFKVNGTACSLEKPPSATASAPRRTASGSVAVAGEKARVARAARIVVEGVHDAELVERVWGDDLRVEGVVVERLDGIDHLEDFVAEFGPAPHRRLGVLVDHLVPNSKESRVAKLVQGPNVLVTGTPYVDVWAAVRPSVVGIERWPDVPMGVEWKEGVCAALGIDDRRAFWRRILGSVRSYADLEVSVVGAVERLIDFVTAIG